MKRKTVALHAIHYKIKSFTIYSTYIYVTGKCFFPYNIVIKLKDIFEKMSYMTAIFPYYCVLQFSHHIMQQISCMDVLAAAI